MATKKSKKAPSSKASNPLLQVEVESETPKPADSSSVSAPELPSPVSPPPPPPPPSTPSTPPPPPPPPAPPTHLSPLPTQSTKHISLESPASEISEPSRHAWLPITLGLLVIILLAGGGYYLYRSGQLNFLTLPASSPSASPSITSPAPSPSPSPSPSGLTRQEISVEVLNGTNLAGLASRAANTLQTLGYTEITTGNSLDDAAVSQLFIDPELEEELDVLLADLEEHFGIATISGYLANPTTAARLILGPDAD